MSKKDGKNFRIVSQKAIKSIIFIQNRCQFFSLFCTWLSCYMMSYNISLEYIIVMYALFNVANTFNAD